MLDPCKRLEQQGYEVTFLRVDKDGRVDPGRGRGARSPTRRSSSRIMPANNEIGTVQPHRRDRRDRPREGVLFHCDATQAVGKVAVRRRRR